VDNPVVNQVEEPPDLIPAQVRAARALLGWTRAEVARRFEIGDATIARLERGDRVPGRRVLPRIKEGFESAGIVFFNDARGCGAALATPRKEILDQATPDS
jgi:transcriptional regulator with XRE-family HTH domain